jgi:hypothetical protein
MSDGMTIPVFLISLLILADSYLVLNKGTTLVQRLIGADHTDSRVRIIEGVGWTAIRLFLMISAVLSWDVFG